MRQVVDFLMRQLRFSIGNKVYMRSIESLLNRVELTPEEAQALRYLAQDLAQMQIELSKAKRNGL